MSSVENGVNSPCSLDKTAVGEEVEDVMEMEVDCELRMEMRREKKGLDAPRGSS